MRKVFLFISMVVVLDNVAGAAEPANKDEYIFIPELFRGEQFSSLSIERLTKSDNIPPGNYKLDIYVNNYLLGQFDVDLLSQPDGSVAPCLTPEILKKAGVRLPLNDKRCFIVSDAVKGGMADLDIARLRLNLTIPQSELTTTPRGYVDPENLNTGIPLLFTNYIANYYHVSYVGNGHHNLDSLWLSLNGGINLGKWQLRQLSNINWSDISGAKWNSIRTYVQRPLPGLNSQLTFGEMLTNGRFFSSLNYNGVSLSSDERMLPDSLRGYAPVIRGVANTTAKVTVSQNGQMIYQTTVPPGAFNISDLYPTSYSGDLDVTVTEADGSISQFTVPYSALPESMRPGLSRYSVETGRTKGTGHDTYFSDILWQRGISNAITLNTGLRVASGYQALMLGSVYGSYLGSFGLDMTYSRAAINRSNNQGWMAHLSWSKSFIPTNTTITVAGYRYSTSGYRDLGDILALREAGRYKHLNSSTYRQLSRFDVSLSQAMGTLGNLFVTGSTQNYRDGRSRDTQLQLGYSNTFLRDISLNLSVARQRISGPDYNNNTQTVTSLALSIPLHQTGTSSTLLSTSVTRGSDGSEQYQNSLSGMIGSDQTTSYGLSLSANKNYKQRVVSGNLQKRLSNSTLGFNASQGSKYWQISGNAQGAVVAHSGGITLGPYLGDTFALIEAKGASGAKVFNSQQLVIDKSGYALVPSLAPYRYARITLSADGINDNAELINNEERVAPVAGAGVKVVFRTRHGNALLIKTQLADGSPIPLGADVFDENHNIIGMTGQAGQIYVRAEKTHGTLTVVWGQQANQSCQLNYAFTEQAAASPLINLNALCRIASNGK